MIRIIFIWIIILTISSRVCLFSVTTHESVIFFSIIPEQDTLKENQSLYSGKVWKNMYHRVNGDQFLFANYFLPGTVSTYGKTFKNLLIRYDIYSDEIMIPVNREEIVQLNKEMIDSFAITFENKVYRFSNIKEDSLNGIKGIKGYFYVLFKNRSALYIKYKKDISTHITEKSDGSFMQTQKIYFVNDHLVHPVSSTNDFFKAFKTNEVQIRNWLKTNNLRVSKKRPESFVPVIKFYENMSQ